MRRDGQKDNGSLVAVAAAFFLVTVTAAHASVEISSAPTKHMHCAKGLCTPKSKKAVLNVIDLTTMLANEDVKITTGAGAVTITVFSPFSWTSAHRLTLDASYNVTFQAPVTVAGKGAVTITYNDSGSGGDLIFFPGAKLDFWDTSSNLIINGGTFALVRNLEALAVLVKKEPSAYVALVRHDNASRDGTYPSAPLKPEFNGVFEGLGHSISNLKIVIPNGQRTGPVGLFKQIGTLGTVRDINLVNESINAGAGGSHVGGLAGYSDGTIRNVYLRADIQGGIRTETGGLVGANYRNGKIIRSGVRGSITSPGALSGQYGFTGGLAGNNSGSIDRSYAIVDVDGGNGHEGEDSLIVTDTGGLVAYNEGSISESFVTGSVKSGALSAVGALVGYGYGSLQENYSLASVTGVDYASNIGGLVGTSHVQIHASYSTGLLAVDGTDDVFLGGLLGLDGTDPGSVTNAFWDLDTSGVSDPSQGAGSIANDPGITGLTDAQLKSGLPAGFDPAIWGQKANINNGYPYLLANPPPQ